MVRPPLPWMTPPKLVLSGLLSVSVLAPRSTVPSSRRPPNSVAPLVKPERSSVAPLATETAALAPSAPLPESASVPNSTVTPWSMFWPVSVSVPAPFLRKPLLPGKVASCRVPAKSVAALLFTVRPFGPRLTRLPATPERLLIRSPTPAPTLRTAFAPVSATEDAARSWFGPLSESVPSATITLPVKTPLPARFVVPGPAIFSVPAPDRPFTWTVPVRLVVSVPPFSAIAPLSEPLPAPSPMVMLAPFSSVVMPP